jgi:signal transduction histidine kinase/putative methionine-R-sulfoxide reductase with GAF domain
MGRMHIQPGGFVSRLQWLIPLMLAVCGVSATLFEQLTLHGHHLSTPHVIFGLLYWGSVGPALAWLMLTWVIRARTAQQELTFRNRELAALNAIGEAASQSLDLNRVLQTALENMVDLIGLEAADIRLAEAKRLILKGHHGVSPDFTVCESSIQINDCLCGLCARSLKTISVDDLATDPSLRDSACRREGFLSVASIPLQLDDQLVGTMHVASRQRHAFTPRDLQTLTAIGCRVAIAANNARLYAEARRRAVAMESISLIGQRMTSALDLDSLMAEIVKLIRKTFGYYHCGIMLVDQTTKVVLLRAASGSGARALMAHGVRLRIGQDGISGWVAHTGQALLCNDVSREPLYYAAELLPETRAELAVPLRVGKRIIGVLDVQDDRCDAFSKEDVTVLQILGNQVGIAVENARLFRETQQRYEAMVALHETSLDLVSQLDREELLGALLRRGVRLLGAQAGALFLYDAAQELIYNVANYNTARDWTGVTLRPGEGVIGQIVLTNQPLIVNDYENWRERAQIFVGVPHTIVMGAPLRWQEQVIGGIVALNERQSGPFDSNDLWLLSLFADLAAIAVKNAELHTQVKEFSQGLERKVQERTRALSSAKEEIAAKAEQLRALLAQTTSIQEEERARIARDMHDGLEQLITAARYELRAAREAAESASAAATQERLKAARQVLGEIEREMRRAIYDLTPPVLNATGLVAALQKHVSRFQKLSGVTSDVQVIGAPFRLQPAIERAVFRLVEEALHNVAAHAGAEAASVILDFQASMLRVVVQDNGRGFDCEEWIKNPPGGHLGLLGMQERVASLGGEMQGTSEPGHGTCLTFRLPI